MSSRIITEVQRLRTVHPRAEVVKSKCTTGKSCIQPKVISATTPSVVTTPGSLEINVICVIHLSIDRLWRMSRLRK